MSKKRICLFPGTASISVEDFLVGTTKEQTLLELTRLSPPSDIQKVVIKENPCHSCICQHLYDAERLEYTTAEICGIPALFTRCRVDSDTVPSGLYRYEVCGTGDLLTAMEIAPDIPNSFFGTILVAENLLPNQKLHRRITPDDLDISGRLEYLTEWRYLYGI